MSLVVSEIVAPGIARIAINRPNKRNALSPEARNEMIEAVSVSLGNPNINAIVIGSTKGHF